MKIGIYGFGAVGMALYNELSEYKDLYVLTDSSRYERYTNTTFTVNDKLITPKFITCGVMDFIIVAVKNYDLESILPSLRNFMNSNTEILPLLNGIMAHDIIKNYYKYNRVLYGVINVESNKTGDSCVTSKILNLQFGDEYNFITRNKLVELRRIFSKYHINNHIYQNMKKRVWYKWMLNLAINQTSALYNMTYREMNNPKTLESFNKIFNEVLEVSKYYNIGLDNDDVNTQLEMCRKFSSNRVTSLTLDVNNNRRCEIDSFGLTFLRLANECNIKTPENDKIYKLLVERIS